jgi:hypothetical protein
MEAGLQTLRRMPSDVGTVRGRCNCWDSGVKVLECVPYCQAWLVSFVRRYKVKLKIKWIRNTGGYL